jgi:hypothetical protein
MKGRSQSFFDGSASLSKPWPRRIAYTGLCMAAAIVGGTLAALSVYLLSVTKIGVLVKPVAFLGPEIAAITGLFIGGFAVGVEPKGWRGFLVRVFVSAVGALISGLWTETLARLIIGELESTAKLVLTGTNKIVYAVDFALHMSRATCLGFALLTAVMLRRRKSSRSPVCDLG